MSFLRRCRRSVSFNPGDDIPTDEWELFHSVDDGDGEPCFTEEEESEARKELLTDIYEGLYE